MLDILPSNSYWEVTPRHVVFASFALVVVFLLSRKYRCGLSSIPGPTLASYTGLWRLIDVYKGHAHETAIKLHQKYGPLVRVGPKHVSVSDPDAVKIIYGINTGFTKTGFYPIQEAMLDRKYMPNLFSVRDESFHNRLKRPVANAYSVSALLELEGFVDICTKQFMKILHEQFEQKGKSIDLGEWLQFYAFDVIGYVTFSMPFGFLEKGADVDAMIETIEGILFYSAVIGQKPELHPLLLGNPFLPYLIPAMESWNGVVNFTVKAMSARGDNGTVSNDILGRMKKTQADKPDSIGYREIATHTSVNVFAGSDTTAIALRSIIYNLIMHPQCYHKLQDEIDEFKAQGKLSDPVQMKDANEMPYLQAVMKEAMRLHPSVGLIMERHVPKGGAVIAGKFIPEGTIVGINPWVLHRDKSIYGEDAETFRPERWLEANPEELKAMERCYLNFGAGSRTCIGKNISLMEICKVIPQLLLEFDIELVDSKKPLKVVNYWFAKQTGLNCILKSRRKSGES